MKLYDEIFIRDLKDAFRSGMTEALRHYKSLSQVDVRGVERTLYPIIRDYFIKYMDSLGYGYLTQNPNFFVIGDTSIAGTNKMADGFICDPELGRPIFAVEIGIDNTDKFWSDYDKCVNVWARTGLMGAFILLFDTEGTDKIVSRLDGAELKTPKNENFTIYPLILPVDLNFDNTMESTTSYRYFERHGDQTCYKVFTLSDRNKAGLSGPPQRWTTDMIAPIMENKKKFFVNRIIDSEQIDERMLKEVLDMKPNLIVLQGGVNPFLKFNDGMRRLFNKYIENNRPIITIFVDHLDSDEWENDETLKNLLPVSFIGRNHRDGQWDYFSRPLYFGKDITARQNNYLDLRNLSDDRHFIKGFVKSKITSTSKVQMDMKIYIDNTEYPFIVTDPEKKVVFIASGTGGWGSDWYKYESGYQLFWSEVINKLR